MVSPRLVGPRKLLNVTIPPYFMCPISLDLMRDPVTLSTGMTYDRNSIEKWLDDGNLTCPATMQELADLQLIPNHTLRRLIQEWCVLNRSKGVERIPTPKLPARPEELKAMLEDLEEGEVRSSLETLKRLRSIVRESERNKRCAVEVGALQVLISILSPEDGVRVLGHNRSSRCSKAGSDDDTIRSKEWIELVAEALATIVSISGVESLEHSAIGSQQLETICWVLQNGTIDAKVNAALVLGGLTKSGDLKNAIAEVDGVTEALVALLREQFYPKAVKAGLKCLLALCTVRKNRIKAVEVGAVSALVEILPTAETRGILERASKILEHLSSCAEGREAISEHALAIPMLVKLLLKAPESSATEHAVVILWMACMYSSNCSEVRDSAVQAGGFTKLLLLLQTECSQRTKQKAVELLKLLRDVWSQHPCSPGKKVFSRVNPF